MYIFKKPNSQFGAREVASCDSRVVALCSVLGLLIENAAKAVAFPRLPARSGLTCRVG